jgi:NIMA-interacting peptidyl-prolyl cis-trans isomerase 1
VPSTMRRSPAIPLVVALIAGGCGKPSADPVASSPVPEAMAPEPSAPTSALDASAASSDAQAQAAEGVASAAAPDTIIAQHILVAYKGAKRAPKNVTRSKAEAKARAAEARSKIGSGTTFEDAVRDYSDDTGSAERLGSVGKFHRGDMHPAFSAAAFALRVGQVSDVVETPFGFHVIKRTQ